MHAKAVEVVVVVVVVVAMHYAGRRVRLRVILIPVSLCSRVCVVNMSGNCWLPYTSCGDVLCTTCVGFQNTAALHAAAAGTWAR